MSSRKPSRACKAGTSQDREALEVFCRVKPVERDVDVCIAALSSEIVTLTHPSKPHESPGYKFTHVFGQDASQKDVFDAVALPLVADALKGKSGLLFAYGVTNSGKTYTMYGEPSNIGIVPRCVDVVFNSIAPAHAAPNVITFEGNNSFSVHSLKEAYDAKEKAGVKILRTNSGFKKKLFPAGEERIMDHTFVDEISKNNYVAVFASFVENHESKIFDLLDEKYLDPIQRTFPNKRICDVPHSDHAFVKDLVEVEVRSPQEALDVLNMGQKRRRTAATSLNSGSSRGHAIFTLKFVHTSRANVIGETDSNAYVVSQLSLVDLAGSERNCRTGNTGKLRNEANCINSSLMNLRHCLEILRGNQIHDVEAPVPFRNAKITQLFKGFFVGHGRIRVLVCVNPSIDDYDENICVLNFAAQVRDISTKRALPAHFVNNASIGSQICAERMVSEEFVPSHAEDECAGSAHSELDAISSTETVSGFLAFSPSDLLNNLDDPKWDLLSDGLHAASNAVTECINNFLQTHSEAKAELEDLVIENGGLTTHISELDALIDSQDNDIRRLEHIYSAIEGDRDQLQRSLTRTVQKNEQLRDQIKQKKAEIRAMRAQTSKKETDKKLAALEEAMVGNVIAERADFFDSLIRREQKHFDFNEAARKRLLEIREVTMGASDVSALDAGDTCSVDFEQRARGGVVRGTVERFERMNKHEDA